MRKINYWKLIGSIAICLGVGFLSFLFTKTSVDTWYRELAKPEFTPPNWLFSPIWSLIYLIMGISLYFIWSKKKFSLVYDEAMSFFRLQLLLNIFWGYIFFYLHSPFWAFVEILVLWITILVTGFFFYLVSRKAAFLFIPYFLWVTYAAVLNFFIYYLNK